MRTPRNERLSSDISDDGPERKCILSGRRGARDELVRLAIAPEGADGACAVLPDALARAPGRGAWIGVGRADLEKALAKGKLKGALAHAFKGARFAIPEDLPEKIDAALARALTDRLGLEWRAGNILLGSDRIAEAARGGRIVWLGHAADARDDGNRKLDQAWRVGRESEGSGLAGAILPLDRAALSVALGRDNVVHLALIDSTAAARLAVPLQRLALYRGSADPTGAVQTGQDAQIAGSANADPRATTMMGAEGRPD
jgi:predicted RNA-binding protein YlxR (DUF448 family)